MQSSINDVNILVLLHLKIGDVLGLNANLSTSSSSMSLNKWMLMAPGIKVSGLLTEYIVEFIKQT